MIVWPPQLNRFKPKTLKTKRIAVSGGILFAAVLTSASIFATGPDAEPEVRLEKSWPVSVLAIEPKKLSPTFSAYGRIESSNVAKIRTDLGPAVDFRAWLTERLSSARSMSGTSP